MCEDQAEPEEVSDTSVPVLWYGIKLFPGLEPDLLQIHHFTSNQRRIPV